MADNSEMALSGDSDGDEVTADPSQCEDPTEDCTIIRVYSLIKEGFHLKNEETQGIELTLNETDFENLFELSSSEGEEEEHLASETQNPRLDYSDRSVHDVHVTSKVNLDSPSLGTSSHQEEEFSIPTFKKLAITNVTEMSSHNFQSQTEELSEPISATDTNVVFTSMLDLSAKPKDSINMIVSKVMSKILDTLDSEEKYKKNIIDASSVLNKSKRPLSGDMDCTGETMRSENEQTPRHGGSISSKNMKDKAVSSLGTILGFLVEEARSLPSQDFATCNVSSLSQQNAKRKLTFEENYEKKRERKDGHVQKNKSSDLSPFFDSVIQKYKRLNEEGKLFNREDTNVPREIVSNKKKRGRPRKDKGMDSIDKSGEISKQKPDNEGVVSGYGNRRNCPETTMRKRGTSKKRQPITYANGKKAIQPESPPKKKGKFTKNHENCHVKRKRKYTVKKKKNCPDIRNSSSSQSSGFCANIHEGIVLRNVSVSVSIGPTNPFVSLCGKCHHQEVPHCEKNSKKNTHEQDMNDQVPSHFSTIDQETYSRNEKVHQVDHSYALTSSKQQETSPTQKLASVSEILKQFVNRRMPKDESDCDGKYKINLLPGDLYTTPTIQHQEATPQLVPTASPLTYPYIGSSVKPWIRYSGHGNEVIALMRPVLLDDPSCASEANILRFEPSAMDLSSNLNQHSLDHNYALTSSNHQETFPRSILSCFSSFQPSFETFSEESSDFKSDNYFSEYEEESFSAEDFDQGPLALDLSTNKNAATNWEPGGSLSDAHSSIFMNQEKHIDPLKDTSCDEDFQGKSFQCLSTKLPNINQGCANSSINSETHAVNDFCESKYFEDSARNLDNCDPTSNSDIQTTQIFYSNDLDKFSMNNTDPPDGQENYHSPPDNLFTACLSQPVAPVNQFFQTTPRVYSSYQEVYEKQFLHANNTCLKDVNHQSDLTKSTTDSLFDIQSNNGEAKRSKSDQSENCQDLKPLFGFESKPLNEQFSRYSLINPYSSSTPQLANLENFESSCYLKSEENQSYADSASATDTCSYHDDYPQRLPSHFPVDTPDSPVEDKSVPPSGRIGLSVQDLSTENGVFVQYEKEIDSSTMTLDQETGDGLGDVDQRNVLHQKVVITPDLNFHDEQRADADGRSESISFSQVPLSCPSIEEPRQYNSGFESHNKEDSQPCAKRQIPATHLQDGDYPFPENDTNVSSKEETNYPSQSLATELNSPWQEQKVPIMSDPSSTSPEDINQDEAALLLTQLCGDPMNYFDICSDISEESFNLSIFDLSTEMGSGSGIDSPCKSESQELECHGQSQQEELVCHGQSQQKELVCHWQPQKEELVCHGKPRQDELVCHGQSQQKELVCHGQPQQEELVCHGQSQQKELVCHGQPQQKELVCHGQPQQKELVCHGQSQQEELVCHGQPQQKELACHGQPQQEELVCHGQPQQKELVCHGQPQQKELVCHGQPQQEELVCHGQSQQKELVCHGQPQQEELVCHGQSQQKALVCHGQPQQKELVCHGQSQQKELVCHGQPQQEELVCHGQPQQKELVCHGQPQQKELVCHGQPQQEELVCHGQPQQEKQSGGSQFDKDSLLFVMADTVSSLFSEGKPNGLHMPPPPECDIVEIKAHHGSTSPGDEGTFHSGVPDYHQLKSIENTFMAMCGDTMDWYGDEGPRYEDEKTDSSEGLEDFSHEVFNVPQRTSKWSSMVFCERCDFTCVILENLFIHYWTCHRLEQMILCPGCRSVFVYLDVYKKHAAECHAMEKRC